MATKREYETGVHSLSAGLTFSDKVGACLKYLQQEIPFGCWTLTRLIGDDLVVLYRTGRIVRGSPSGCIPAAETICSRATRDWTDLPAAWDGGSQVSGPIRKSFELGSFIGVKLFHSNGDRLGSLYAMETRRKNPPRGARQIRMLTATAQWLVRLIQNELRLRHRARVEYWSKLIGEGVESPWVSKTEWLAAMKFEEGNRQALNLPAAVLGISIKDIVTTRNFDMSGRLQRIENPQNVIAEMLGNNFIGSQSVFHNSSLVLLPECDNRSAKTLEVRIRQLAELRGVNARVLAASARYDESLARLAMVVARGVGTD